MITGLEDSHVVSFPSLPPSIRDCRLGRNGADEVKSHRFFKQDQWTWENIRQQVPPVVPELTGDTDTQYFDVIDDEKEKPESFATPRVSQNGTRLPQGTWPKDIYVRPILKL